MEPIKSVTDLKRSFQKLPGIGEKTAERLAYASLRFKKEELDEFINALYNVKTNVHPCPNCGMYIDTPSCPICNDPSRNDDTLLVVSDSKNIISFEKTDTYHGLYFVLGGCISPIKNISPEDIRIPQLLKNIKENNVKEIILALSSTIEGETTALYIAQLLKNSPIKVTRLAYGLPLGADLEYVDEITISRSLEGRTTLKGEEK